MNARLRRAKIDLSETLSTVLNGRTLDSVLHDVFDARGLTWVVRHDMLIVTTPQGAQRRPLELVQEPGVMSERLAKGLAGRASIDVFETALPQVFAELEQVHKVAIQIDEVAMRDRALPDVTAYGFHTTTLRHMLEFLLDQHELMGVIDGDTIWIRPLPEAEAGSKDED